MGGQMAKPLHKPARAGWCLLPTLQTVMGGRQRQGRWPTRNLETAPITYRAPRALQGQLDRSNTLTFLSAQDTTGQ